MAQREDAIAEGIADAALATGLPLIAYSDCAMSEVFTRRGIAFSCEFYADLDYDDDGRQIIAKQHRAVSAAEVAAKVKRAVDEGFTRSISGKDVPVVAQSICVYRHAERCRSLQRPFTMPFRTSSPPPTRYRRPAPEVILPAGELLGDIVPCSYRSRSMAKTGSRSAIH